jgi:hypothetical protein
MSEDQPEVGSNTVDNTEIVAPRQGAHYPLSTVGARSHTYDPTTITNFINKVFHTAVTGHRLTYVSKTNIPNKPQPSVAKLISHLNRITAPRALYFCASTCAAAPDGTLSHRKSLFTALHVVVLDDIGTKIKHDDLPDLFKQPSYVIETSPSNYQYGFILETPLTNYDAATRLIQTLAIAGFTDTGGAMPCKLVRLPDGVNGKDTPEKRGFHVNLASETDLMFTPEQLVTAAAYEFEGTLVTWDEIENASLSPLAKKYNNQYLSRQPIAQSTTGEIDEVLEWLYENDLVLSDSGDGWVEITCPNCTEHSDPNATSAFFLPLGRGGTTRGFNCFHDHCSELKTQWYMSWIMSKSDFDVLAVYQTAHVAHGEHAYCRTDDKVYTLSNGKGYPLQSFKRAMRGVAYVVDGGGKGRAMHPVDLWLRSPYLIVIDGAKMDVASPDRIVENNGTKDLNEYVPVPWGKGAFDQAEVDVITEYIEYLFPVALEREYLMNWLAAKVQNPMFRGSAIVMITPNQGVGRSTLCDMVRTLVGQRYTQAVPFEKLTGEANFNEWADKILIAIDESSQTGDAKQAKQAYNRLKEEIDTGNRLTTMNRKYQMPITVKACASFMIASNYVNGVAMDKYDRRMTVMRNTDSPRDGQFFVGYFLPHLARLDADGLPTWGRHFYRYLLTITPDLPLLSRALVTQSKAEAINASMSYVEKACYAVEQYFIKHSVCFASFGTLSAIVMQAIASHDGVEVKPKAIEHAFNRFSTTFIKNKKINGVTQRVRIFTNVIATAYSKDEVRTIGENRANKWSDIPSAIIAEILDDINSLNSADLLTYLEDELV